MNNFRQFIISYPSRVYKKGEMILLQGDAPKTMYIIQVGLVKVYAITSGGDEHLISIGRGGEDFPIGYAFGIIDRAQYFYEAFTSCTIRFIPRDDYIRYISSDIDVMRRRMVRLTILLLSTYTRVDALEQSRASDKIVQTLLYMGDQFSLLSRPYSSQLKLPVTQQEIADSLGVTRETANIELKKLEIKKLISHSRRSYVLYMERLRKYIDGK